LKNQALDAVRVWLEDLIGLEAAKEGGRGSRGHEREKKRAH
jgi:hypothetical protein